MQGPEASKRVWNDPIHHPKGLEEPIQSEDKFLKIMIFGPQGPQGPGAQEVAETIFQGPEASERVWNDPNHHLKRLEGRIPSLEEFWKNHDFRAIFAR